MPHGIVDRADLRRLGLSDDQIDRRIKSGLLVPRYRGVYSVGRRTDTDEAEWLAAVKACSAGAVLSHRSAARLWGLIQARSRLIEVTVPTTAGAVGHRLVIVHRSTTLEPVDTTYKRSIPVTRPARTIVDYAENSNRRGVERILDEVVRLGLCREEDVRASAERHPTRSGSWRVLQTLAEHEAGSTATANDFEELFLSICDSYGIPRPRVNLRKGAITPDFLWAHEKVIVETDGWATHGRQRRVFESDRERDVMLTAKGWRVLRFTWRQLADRPQWVASQVSSVLRSAGSSSARRNS